LFSHFCSVQAALLLGLVVVAESNSMDRDVPLGIYWTIGVIFELVTSACTLLSIELGAGEAMARSRRCVVLIAGDWFLGRFGRFGKLGNDFYRLWLPQNVGFVLRIRYEQ
jgi:hypothetical protein